VFQSSRVDFDLARGLRMTPAAFYVSFLSCSDLKSAKPQLLASRDLILAANVSTFDNLSIITCSEGEYTPRKVLKATTEQR